MFNVSVLGTVGQDAIHPLYLVYFQINANGYIQFSPEGSDYVDAYYTQGRGLTINGTVSYRTTTDTVLLCRASQKVRSFFLDRSNYEATWMLVVTWRTSYSFTEFQQFGRVKREIPQEEAQVGEGLNGPSHSFFLPFLLL